MRKALPLAFFLAFVGATVASLLLRDDELLSAGLIALALAALVSVFVVAPQARASLSDRFPRSATLGRRAMALQGRTIAAALAAGLAMLGAAELWERTLFPEGDLREHLRDRYGSSLVSDRPPLHVSKELDEVWPAEDQRYTAAGIFLRYEDDIVALLPVRGGTDVQVMPELDGFRRWHPYVGAFWGPSYRERTDAVPSARAVPSDADLAATARELRHAQRWQDVCYGWDVEIRSGRRKGRLVSWTYGIGHPGTDKCAGPRVRLVGWIDPEAGRFTRRGDPGDWSLAYEWRGLAGPIPQAAIDAIDTPHVEVIGGATQKPRGDGSRAGKGLLESIGALPLLAQETPGVPPVPPRVEHVAEDERPAPVQRSDSERRADASWTGAPPAFLRVAAVALIGFVLLAGLAGLVARAVRRVL